jgi:hypothetical protein
MFQRADRLDFARLPSHAAIPKSYILWFTMRGASRPKLVCVRLLDRHWAGPTPYTFSVDANAGRHFCCTAR